MNERCLAIRRPRLYHHCQSSIISQREPQQEETQIKISWIANLLLLENMHGLAWLRQFVHGHRTVWNLLPKVGCNDMPFRCDACGEYGEVPTLTFLKNKHYIDISCDMMWHILLQISAKGWSSACRSWIIHHHLQHQNTSSLILWRHNLSN